MELWQALLLGLIEGLTEYLPVSSTGHLLVAQRLLGIESNEASNAYAIAIQAGAIMAVLGLYRRRVGQMAMGIRGRDRDGARLLTSLMLAFFPAAVAGLALHDAIESILFGAWPVVIAWALGGFVILGLDRNRIARGGLGIESIDGRIALIVGVAQCAALWPGVSRSLATILGGLFAGLSMAAAVEFSFLLGLVTLGAATGYKAVQSGSAMLTEYGAVALLLGFVTAWLAAIASVRFMVEWLKHRSLAIFAWWRIGLATVVALLLAFGVLDAAD